MPRTHPEVGGKRDNGDKETVTPRSGTPEKQKLRSRRVNQSVGCQKREEAQTDREALFSGSVLVCPTFLQCWRLEK